MFSEDGEVERPRLEARVRMALAVVAAATWPVRFGLRLALVLLRVAPILLLAHARTLEKLTLAERVKILDRLERSSFMPLCLAFVGWRTITTLVFYEDPSELRALGYTSDERHRHKRLPLLAPAVLSASGELPIPQDSGVRLASGDVVERDSERSRVA